MRLIHKLCGYFCFSILFCCLCIRIQAEEFHLSNCPVQVFFDAGKKDGEKIRWFADDDFGLSLLLTDIRDRKISVSSPYELLPSGNDFLFIGIGDGLQNCTVREIIDFTKQGNVAVLLLPPEKFKSYAKDLSDETQTSGQNFSNCKDVLQFHIDTGCAVLVQDIYAFSNVRFQENQPLWKFLLQSRIFKAVRIVQRARYTSKLHTIFTASAEERKISPPIEQDPAFAPSFTDSNSKKYYEMTQNYFFLSEKYYRDGVEIKAWKSMMRVRAYDKFVPPDPENPNEWHFAISNAAAETVKVTDKIPSSGFKIIRVQTGLAKNAPPDRITLASLAPDAKLLSINVYSAKVQNIREEELLAKKLSRGKAVLKETEQTPWWSLFAKETQQSSSSAQMENKNNQLQKQYDDLKRKNRLIGNGIPDRLLSDVKTTVIRDKLNNWTVRLPLKDTPVFLTYEVAVPEIFIRRDERDFKDELIPDQLSVKELCRQQRQHGVYPCPVPKHEKEALSRMIGKERFPWFQPGKIHPGHYLPFCVEQALQGKDVTVKELFYALSNYARLEFKDSGVFMKDEFNSFHEAMLYWKAGVCRHRARLGYMILNTLGITARCVTTREHAYTEVYLPYLDNGKGGWTYLDFGGGPGADFTDTYFEIIPSPALKIKPISDGLSHFVSNQALYLSIIILSLFCFCAVFFIVIHRIHRKNKDRFPMPVEGNFMASMETVIADELKHQDFSSAALILMEASKPFLKESAQQQITDWQSGMQGKMYCSRHQYENIVEFIRQNKENTLKGESK